MARGRPTQPVTKKDVQSIVKKEISKALARLEVTANLVGTKPKGRPLGFRPKAKRGMARQLSRMM